MWPTARSFDGAIHESPEAWEERRKRKAAEGINLQYPLTIAAMQWPTATSTDQKSSGSAAYSTESGRHSGTTLTDAAKQWPTPYGLSSSNGPDGNEFSTAVRNWPSPRSEDSESCGNHPNATDSLTGAITLWHTPDNGSGKSTRGATAEPYGLQTDVELWATPSASKITTNMSDPNELVASEGGKLHLPDGRPVQTALTDQCERWTTPQASARAANGSRYSDNESSNRGGQANLADDVDNWATPQAHDSRRPSDDNSTQGRNLQREADNWATPQAASDAKDNMGAYTYKTLLKDVATWNDSESSHQAPATHAGPPSCETSRGSHQPSPRKRLNPAFTNFLMGAPVFWTVPYAIGSNMCSHGLGE